MKRKVSLPSTLLLAAPLLLSVLPALAQDAPGPIISIIGGLAPDDLLNIRATASPGGKVAARLPNGAAVKNFGCNVVNGHPWCKVEDTQDAHIVGWAPARYLSPNNPAPAPDDGTVPTTGDSAAAPAETPPPDIATRLGGSEPAEPPSAAEIGRTAMLDAYGLAVAAAANAGSDAPAPDAGIPCARHVGQPMTRCEISVAHTGGESAVTVTWPDGGSRVITFHDGQPSGSDSPDEFRFTREGSLNMIRIGVSERFEITDQLALGD
ncbi:SH3 domain-containing protein [Mesorhizobium sp. M2D.F.Ca.ET.185.01.1.1]|uniref:SH3 domain-containing protein n=1 Tax=unclassified Mesorhizobium TaxID=325217 RepID=UPI000FCA0E8F|nr:MULTISPECIES: SH3 domain-containing protein [unclassified Mesorhizobium]TGP73945.1 SH3 domain-containing protein [bacterium M00.F.Ca.ET.227.01.1.1]TGP85821.1 SH3 domain-containing protein [bacterium M00.F.Ca.ET.221.01.1.1]TGP91048.1 SH3 domain-containing protein [bacterium M00.F.Ca.ET.222.01.1.1]TGU02995.1 SH3 domain-containing protein [bacterium M00.F.Ca.ET.163.01.1.1]TGU20227.1 SH3 domain-containing protein [bacterium M00.F.Ca.ET.156.01.1.1]TGU44249.1 SH3 domain-containing protein [bacte